MIFAVDFPNLKIKEQILVAGEPNEEPRYTRWTMEKLLEDIQEYCLDKARVNKIIDIKIAKLDRVSCTEEAIIWELEELKEELGL